MRVRRARLPALTASVGRSVGRSVSVALDVNQAILTGDNQNINMYQSCAGDGYIRFVFVASDGFGSFDIHLNAVQENIDPTASL
eukprot:SAG22_NODE_2592_length_2407_cov_1.497834_4_plen_84_part_00